MITPSEIEKLLGTVNIGILILDTINAKILFQNKYFTDLLSDHYKFFIEHLFKYIHDKKKFKIHNDIDIDDNLTFGYSIYPVNGKKDKSIILVSDISSKKIYMDAKNRKNYYKKLSKYSSEIAHEVGNPLTSVIMTLQVLSKNLLRWEIDKKEEYIETTIRELKRLSNFMTRIRDLSKDYDLEMKKINLKEIINRVILQNKARLDQNNLIIIEKINNNIEIYVDDEAFYQIIFNLIQNSIDILPAKSKISLEVEEVNNFFVKLVFSNNGPPIPESILEKIFLPFFSTKGGGSGIGLDLSLKLMTNMGGSIEVKNLKKGGGVKFTLHIPEGEENENSNTAIKNG